MTNGTTTYRVFVKKKHINYNYDQSAVVTKQKRIKN